MPERFRDSVQLQAAGSVNFLFFFSVRYLHVAKSV